MTYLFMLLNLSRACSFTGTAITVFFREFIVSISAYQAVDSGAFVAPLNAQKSHTFSQNTIVATTTVDALEQKEVVNLMYRFRWEVIISINQVWCWLNCTIHVLPASAQLLVGLGCEPMSAIAQNHAPETVTLPLLQTSPRQSVSRLRRRLFYRPEQSSCFFWFSMQYRISLVWLLRRARGQRVGVWVGDW